MLFSELAKWMHSNFTACTQTLDDIYIETAALARGRISLPQPNTVIIIEVSDYLTFGLSSGNSCIMIGEGANLPDIKTNAILIQDKGVAVSQIYDMVIDKLRKQAHLNWELARLYHFFLTDDFIEPLMDHIYKLFGNQIVYVDYSHHVLSVRRNGEANVEEWDSAIAEGRHPANYIHKNFHNNVKNLISSKDYYYQELGGMAYYAWSVNDGKTLFGYFAILATNRNLREDDIAIMRRIVDLTAVKLCKKMIVSSKGDYSEIIKDLIIGGINDELDLDYRLMTRKWDKTDIYQIFLIDMQNSSERTMQYANSEIDSLHSSVKHIIYEQNIVVLVQNMNMLPYLIKMLCQYCIDSNLRAGVSEPFRNLFNLRAYFDQAEKAISFGNRMNPKDLIHYYASYKYIDWLTECNNKLDCKKYYHMIVEELDFYDAKNKTDFFSTLLAYLEHGKSINKTCACLHLHKNTVNYRIQRIKELFGIDYDDGQTTQHMYLSLKMHSLKREAAKAR
ncbi:MAG: helix-turn-helix domain-containing protein [Clostridiales bacterium]|nr:helix-turn-helix domain-containing protein [Clostridiales bacterium]